jgi:AcrR family transcriptional regulator
MSRKNEPALGLRERKKIKLRRAIQTEALRLFEAQGYERTTVEQIADAAETSTTTFYRYFPTKEDVVLRDDYDPIAEAVFAARPADEPLAETLRAAVSAIVDQIEVDHDETLVRLRLIYEVPALIARSAGELRQTVDMMARLVAARTGQAADNYQLRLTVSALVAVQSEAAQTWARRGGRDSLFGLINDAITTIEPLLVALESLPPTKRKRPAAQNL